MPFAQIGIPGLILLVIVALIIFGPKKLPEIGKAAGQTLKEFKDSTNELVSENEEKDTKDEDASDSTDASDATDKADEKSDTEKTS